MTRIVAIAVLCAAFALTGCKGPCRQLSEQMCDCTLNSLDKTSCLQRASANETANPPSPEDDVACEELIKTCDCRLIDTAAGKVRCGLARGASGAMPTDAGQ